MYNKYSSDPNEFINHEEILDTLDFAQKNKNNKLMLEEILNKASLEKGLSHREAAVLLLSDEKWVKDGIFSLAKKIKENYYGNRIVLFAPLYLSNYCVNNCVYCPYHAKNKNIVRIKLTQEQIKNEVIALQDLGHKRLALELGEDPVNNPIDYVLESIDTIYSIKHKNGSIRRVNVNIAATTVENYKKLHDRGIGTYILFQETYNKKSYEKLHPYGPKHDYDYHTTAMDRAQEGGIDDVDPKSFKNALADDIFEKIIGLIRLSVPYTGMIISTRESKIVREKALALGISQISGGSRTTVGGYANGKDVNSAQFELADNRTLEEVVDWLIELGYIPSFCTACYRAGRTGDRFMALCKSKQILNCCQPNALMTLKEYLLDYGSDFSKELGEKLIDHELKKIPRDSVRERAKTMIAQMAYEGKRDFRF